MKIFVMRHGEAEVLANSDKERKLTQTGQQQARQQGQWLSQVQTKFDKVLVSPYIRAQQTLEQLACAYQGTVSDDQQICQEITPYGRASHLIDELSLFATQGIESLLMVSHLPLVGEIVTALCGQNPASFYPATIVMVDWQLGEKGRVIEIKYPVANL